MDAYYQLVRLLDYTWEDVMSEKFVRTTLTLERLEDEAEKRREQKEEMEREAQQAKQGGGGMR